jgi:hypothetical protein
MFLEELSSIQIPHEQGLAEISMVQVLSSPQISIEYCSSVYSKNLYISLFTSANKVVSVADKMIRGLIEYSTPVGP